MNTDSVHGLALLAGLGSVCGGTYLMAGAGLSLVVFGGILLLAVIYSRTRSADVSEPD